jgi:hypothetical protein
VLGTATAANASSGSAAATPFAPAGCEPKPRSKRCARATRAPVRVTRTLVRPNARKGGTTIVFALKKRTLVRFTVIRVYPSCERVGSFSVRARKGVNRIRFRGRLGRRALADGTYRLVAQARGQRRAAATVTIVVARGRPSAASLARARRANACSSTEASELEAALGLGPAAGADPDAAAGEKKRSFADPVVSVTKRAAKDAAKKAKGIARGIAEAAPDPLSEKFVLLIVGLFMLALAAMGTIIIYQAVKGVGARPREPLS